MLFPPEAPLSAQAYDFLANLVYERSRIRLGSDKQSLVAGRLAQRLRSLGLSDYEQYCSLLISPDGENEVGELIDLISTNHTHFFREPSHFEALGQHILPALADRAIAAQRPLRVWCAAASSGEEAYSIAIVLGEYCRAHPSLTWHVDASDISMRMLQRCQVGTYEAAKVNLPAPDMLGRYFQRGFGEREGYYRVKSELRRHVTVQYMNLFDSTYSLPPGQDVIFCRNVMIYFDVPSRQLLVQRLTEQLAPGGYLFVGHSESLIGIQYALKTVCPSVYIRPK